MHLDTISSFDALFALLALIAFAALIFRIVPSGAETLPQRRFSDTEIHAHDPALPKYFLVTLAALTVGGLHLAIRSVPGIADWLMRGGYGAHLARDIAYSHMMIVMGGTVAVTGLSWYVLPRILLGPLYSPALAELAFWGTVVGAAGFYLSNVIGGVAMSALQHGGWSADDIDYSIGLWRNLATGLSAIVMGIGYWTFVINVVATIIGGRDADCPRPHGHLAKFFLVGSGALFVGTVQGVLQVVPENVEWLHAAGKAGHLIDPVSHAHVNLISGVLTIVAGIVFYLTHSTSATDGPRERALENVTFWILFPASTAFYLAFVYLGFAEGTLIADNGLSYADAVGQMGWRHSTLIAASGLLTFVGIWLFLAIAVGRIMRQGQTGAPLLLMGAVFLALGTFQGVLQAQPSIRAWMDLTGVAEGSIAGAHAQINIIGGILLLLLGCAFSIGSPIIPAHVSPRLLRAVSVTMGIGALLYYIPALAAALLAGAEIAGGGVDGTEALSREVSWTGPIMVTGAIAYASGAAILLVVLWRSTRQFRRQGWDRFRHAFDRNDTSSEAWRRQVRPWSVVVPEFVAALFGFPGVGWILSGRAMIGGPMVFVGQALAWAVIPMLLSPYGDRRLPQLTPWALETYLISTAIISAGILWWISSRRYYGANNAAFRSKHT